jgi:hypothetical protein
MTYDIEEFLQNNTIILFMHPQSINFPAHWWPKVQAITTGLLCYIFVEKMLLWDITLLGLVFLFPNRTADGEL